MQSHVNRAKARTVVLVLAATMLVLSVVLAFQAGRRDARRELDSALERAAGQDADRLFDHFDRARSDALLLAQNPSFRDFYLSQRNGSAKGDVEEALDYLSKIYPRQIGEVCFIDANGAENARVVRGDIAESDDLSQDESENPFFKPTFNLEPGQVYQAVPYVSPDTDEWVVSNSTLIPFEDGAKRAIVHFEITIESFRRDVKHDQRVRIVDGRGNVVVDSDHPQRIGADLGRPEDRSFAAGFGGRQSGVMTVDNHRTAFARVELTSHNSNEWYVVVSARHRTTLASGVRVASLSVLGASIVLIIAAFVFHSYQRELRANALTDSLTGLPNRRSLREHLAEAIANATASSQQGALLLMDLDRFKEVNDGLGHHHGDELLRLVGTRVLRSLRDGDIAARLGGDEFAVVLPRVGNCTDVDQVCKRVLSSLSEDLELSGVPIHIAASIGVVMFPDEGADIEVALKRADIAMYRAKRTGGGVAFYSEDVEENLPSQLGMVAELRRAITGGELVLYYQPKVHLATGKVVGVEALVRWNHPTHGLLAPNEFVPVAERTGAIGDLTLYVLRRGLDQLEAWRNLHPSLVLAVNMSSLNLVDERFVGHVASALRESYIDSGRLILELTESSTTTAEGQRMLALLRDLGVGVSIDDFGTGYSSFAYLRWLPATEVKIDRSFVSEFEAGGDGELLRSMISIAHHFGLTVVAEGVERPETVAALKEMGCDEAQGFVLCRPLPAAEIEQWFDSLVRLDK